MAEAGPAIEAAGGELDVIELDLEFRRSSRSDTAPDAAKTPLSAQEKGISRFQTIQVLRCSPTRDLRD